MHKQQRILTDSQIHKKDNHIRAGAFLPA
ncbi:hypothetical protein LQQ61_04750 (plasmid) [Escherichia coli]|nr:hypothetical protein LQQ61_04750 [Escherichia coli]